MTRLGVLILVILIVGNTKAIMGDAEIHTISYKNVTRNDSSFAKHGSEDFDGSDKYKLNILFNNITRYICCLRKFDSVSKFSIQIFIISLNYLILIYSLIASIKNNYYHYTCQTAISLVLDIF